MNEGKQKSGEVFCADLAIPKSAFKQVQPVAKRIDFKKLKQEYLQPRLKAAHKGDFGHALIIGGDHGMAGAVVMAASACAKTGAGLTSVGTHPHYINPIIAGRPEIMAHGVTHPEDLTSLSKKATVIAIGPGLGQSTWSEQLFSETLKFKGPLILDADALNLLAKNPLVRPNWILTPHPGEAARLLNITSRDVQQDRMTAIKLLQKNYGGVIVLKGAGTLICDESQEIYLCDRGNPGMASGGMGDVLTGIIVGFVAQKIPLKVAAMLGVYCHAAAADNAAERLGERGLLAMDLVEYLPRLIN